MASTTSTDGTSANVPTNAIDPIARLTRMGDRSSLMAIDATLRAAREDGVASLIGVTNLAAADEVREMARRMLQATRDFRAVLHEAAE